MISNVLQYGGCHSGFLIPFVTVFFPFFYFTLIFFGASTLFRLSASPRLHVLAGTTQGDKHYDCYFSPVSRGLQLFPGSLRVGWGVFVGGWSNLIAWETETQAATSFRHSTCEKKLYSYKVWCSGVPCGSGI